MVKPAAGLCNMDCGYCFYKTAGAGGPGGIMSDETVRALAERIREARPSSLNIAFQGGEPLLAGPDFFRRFTARIKASVRCPVFYSVQTNGTRLDGATAAFLKENGFLVGLSLDGDRVTTDRYRRMKNGGSAFERVLESAALLKEHGVDFNILSVVDDENAGEIERTYAFMKEQGFYRLQFIPCVDEGRGVALSAEKYEAFLKTSFDLWYNDFTAGNEVYIRHIDNWLCVLLGYPPESCAHRGVCGGYYVVEADGSVYPCDFYCKEEYKLGTVFSGAPFGPSEKMSAFIARSKVIHEHCRGCEYRFLCRGGCLRDRTDGDTSNRYCSACRGFFAYAAGRLADAARTLRDAGGL